MPEDRNDDRLPRKDNAEPPHGDTAQPADHDPVELPRKDTAEPPHDDTAQPADNDTAKPPHEDTAEPLDGDPVELPINGELDLHHFHPRDVKDLVPDYLEECRRRGILEVRIVHGKGTGALRRTVHAVLGKLPYVLTVRQGGPAGGSWGATIANLTPPDDEAE